VTNQELVDSSEGKRPARIDHSVVFFQATKGDEVHCSDPGARPLFPRRSDKEWGLKPNNMQSFNESRAPVSRLWGAS